MQNESGDDYIRRITTFIRTNERGLAEAAVARPRRGQRRPTTSSAFNPLGWFGASDPAPSAPKAIVLSIDTHHLFYLLMRLEAIGIDVGTLDVRVDNPSRPMSYINIFPDPDKSETLSLASFRSSFSAVSNLSLGAGWWGRPGPPTIDTELKFIYSSFTKLPALSIVAPGRKMIAELANEPPNENAIPMDAFKNLQALECIDIDPRTLLGWDILAESLRSLKIKKSGLVDVSDIFIGAVLDDEARRQGSTSQKRNRPIPQRPSRQTSFHATQLPESVPEDTLGESDPSDPQTVDAKVPNTPNPSLSPAPPPELSSRKWEWLKHLSLPDNALTFFPSDMIPYLISITHLDLSSNLLVSVPQGLGSLYNLVSLNISDNMIDSVLGIYLNLGQVLYLNISQNRLESICGLERLHALEKVDLRGNLIEESAEIGRLATLPNITDVWVDGNPFVEIEEGYRVACFDYFWKEGKTVNLDGTPPSFYERRNLTVPPPQQMTSSRPVSAAYSPPTIAVGHQHLHPSSPSADAPDKKPSPASPSSTSPRILPVGAVGVTGKARRKKAKRIVDLDGDQSDGSAKAKGHRRDTSDDPGKAKQKSKPRVRAMDTSPLRGEKEWGQFSAVHDAREKAQEDFRKAGESSAAAKSGPIPELPQAERAREPQDSPRRSHHSRYMTEFPPPTSVDNSAETLSTSIQQSDSAMGAFRRARNSRTISSKSAARRARVTASVYEPSTPRDDEGMTSEIDEAEAFRMRIEALKQDMGDAWLKVFSQTQMKTPS
ncbi:leucine rich repeat domain protein [Moniliophthora roreri MCA 2997]|uniref:Leucine rich repeat domain protein n=2 Tax=Moniliophthora roreri TaxID=221103 RepID=V2Y9V3_MONRO|nr:leucine rich repeat domain protein [Moniliophthora roreri MCA 2997]